MRKCNARKKVKRAIQNKKHKKTKKSKKSNRR